MKIVNKKAKFNYRLLESIEAGIQLTGDETKSIRGGFLDLGNSYAKIINNEVYLINANIPIRGKSENQTRSRKLLLHKDEIISIDSKIKAKKLTLVPVSLYTKGRLIKVKLALAKAKREYEKKEALRKKDIEREIEQELKAKY
ncbi:SsrA-binding protein [Candidatus Woesebacteria bacterium RBG_16_36_11]|uniref:SsrA-binding protein n=3 Tax=Candidatus Woeseibacteriota TaxID=1752722 RepID=A0A1F7XB29_9BACT|nr:MAG: SsrA-binding protein [Candidatus Woesebacteria bacterium RBG_13_36_22]OGM12227.1 MAG: SsrA-binding protein [Candidatus Woesebacteria bacterium RBG_16_36_11]OGM16174.1 MAG: SsrA-binding protein [Candidatus Woesebacteria bacterium RBG_19FT_COMBO_37_29]